MGGNIAMNAGGQLCATYGVTREAVVGLEVVRADGSVMSLGHRAVKGVTGYELTALMIGSEATLAAVRAHAADDDAARLPATGSGASALIGAEALSFGRRSSDRSVRG